jgi:hypothetical protein
MFNRHASTSAPGSRGAVDDPLDERMVGRVDPGEMPPRRFRTRPRPGPDSVRAEALSRGGVATEERPDGTAVAERQRWAHVSSAATFSLIVAVGAIAATLTGLLAPLGFAGGILAVLLGLAAFTGVRRSGVTGHSLVTLGIVLGLAAIVLSVLAMGHQISWLDSRTDEVARLHNWLNNHMHWMRRF